MTPEEQAQYDEIFRELTGAEKEIQKLKNKLAKAKANLDMSAERTAIKIAKLKRQLAECMGK